MSENSVRDLEVSKNRERKTEQSEILEIVEFDDSIQKHDRFYLFLDIDNVLNPRGALFNKSTAWPDFRWTDTRTRDNIVSKTMISELNEFLREYQPTVVTVSRHENLAKFYCNLVGLEGSLDWAWGTSVQRDQNTWAKLESVRKTLTSNDGIAPGIWIDSELGARHEASLWAAENGILALAPTMDHGLTRAHLVQMRSYAEALRAKNILKNLLETSDGSVIETHEEETPVRVVNPDSVVGRAVQFYKSFETLSSSSRIASSERYV